MLNYQFFPKTKHIPGHLQQVVTAFENIYTSIDSEKHKKLQSNEVLAVVSPQLGKISFDVEHQGNKISVPVLFGRNGAVAKSFEADAYQKDTKTVIEVEAGRALTNYQFLKDLFEACMMNDAEYLVIAVKNIYTTRSKEKEKISKDFEKIEQFFDTLYQSERLKLPLLGILLIGY